MALGTRVHDEDDYKSFISVFKSEKLSLHLLPLLAKDGKDMTASLNHEEHELTKKRRRSGNQNSVNIALLREERPPKMLVGSPAVDSDKVLSFSLFSHSVSVRELSASASQSIEGPSESDTGKHICEDSVLTTNATQNFEGNEGFLGEVEEDRLTQNLEGDKEIPLWDVFHPEYFSVTSPLRVVQHYMIFRLSDELQRKAIEAGNRQRGYDPVASGMFSEAQFYGYQWSSLHMDVVTMAIPLMVCLFAAWY